MQVRSEGLCERKSTLEPSVRRFAFAMLTQAIRDIRSNDASKQAREWRNDALRWFVSGRDGAGTFAWVCYVLQCDPAKTRAAIGVVQK